MQKENIIKHIEKSYNTKAVFPWAPKYKHEVFKHGENKKWFALIMAVEGKKLGLESETLVDIINLKCDADLAFDIKMSKGIYPAYHMNKKHWISVILDDTVDDETIYSLINISFELTAAKNKI